MQKCHVLMLSALCFSSVELYSMKTLFIARAFATSAQMSYMDCFRSLTKNGQSHEFKEALQNQSQETKNNLLADVIKAKGFNKQAIIALLEAGADINAADEERNTALHHLAIKSRSEPDPDGIFYAPLIELCNKKYFADFDARGHYGYKPADLLYNKSHRADFSNPNSNNQQLLRVMKKLDELSARITEISEKMTSKKD